MAKMRDCAGSCLLTRKQVAHRLGVSIDTLERWAKLPDRNGLPFIKMPGARGPVRYRSKEVEDFEERHTVRAA